MKKSPFRNSSSNGRSDLVLNVDNNRGIAFYPKKSRKR